MLNLEGMADNGDWDSQKRKVFFSSTHLVFEITKEGRTPFKIFLGLSPYLLNAKRHINLLSPRQCKVEESAVSNQQLGNSATFLQAKARFRR